MCDADHSPLASSWRCFFLVGSKVTASMRRLMVMFLCHLKEHANEELLDWCLHSLSDHQPHFPAVRDALLFLALLSDLDHELGRDSMPTPPQRCHGL